MAWIVLVVSGVLETVWASALAESRGLSRPLPTVLFGVAVVLSMMGLGFALRAIPVGTGYAVWVGIGAVGTAAYGMVALGEPATVARLTCLVLIIAGVVGLKVAALTACPGGSARHESPSSRANRSGCSRCGKWPAPSNSSTRLPGIACCAVVACQAGIIRSWVPQTTRVGTAMATAGGRAR